MGNDFIFKKTILSKEQISAQRNARRRWEEHRTGKPYVLHILNRTSDHSFRVQEYGKNIFQAVRRYYKGLENSGNWVWKCTKVIKVFECSCEATCEEGKRLI